MVTPFDWSVYNAKGGVPWLPKRTVYLTKHGSHAYGTSLPTSDLDLRGIAIPPKEYLLGYVKGFEQAKQDDPDFVVFGIQKFFTMASDCNPNALEIIFTDPSDHLVVTPIAERLFENRKLFLSRRTKHTFAGYAHSQLGRIDRHYKWLKDPPKAPPKREDFGLSEKPAIEKNQLDAAMSMIKKQLDSWAVDFIDHFDPGVRISIVNKMTEYLAGIQIASDETFAAAARLIGFTENFIHMLQREREYRQKQANWDSYEEWQLNRNEARAKLEAEFGYDTKHAMHLVRLMRMCREVLTTGEVHVKRPDAEELLEIRAGKWTYEDLMSWSKAEDKLLDEAMKTSVLPKEVDRGKLDQLCIELIEEGLRVLP